MDNIRELYGVSNRKGERLKGVAQLARLINEILRNPTAAWSGPFTHANVFYPVLLVHDVNLTSPAFGHPAMGTAQTLHAAVWKKSPQASGDRPVFAR
jgi:hypothetical protein